MGAHRKKSGAQSKKLRRKMGSPSYKLLAAPMDRRACLACVGRVRLACVESGEVEQSDVDALTRQNADDPRSCVGAAALCADPAVMSFSWCTQSAGHVADHVWTGGGHHARLTPRVGHCVPNTHTHTHTHTRTPVQRRVELLLLLIFIFVDPGTQFPGHESNYAMQYRKVPKKSSWNEPYSSSSFTKQFCSKMALYRWIKTESRWNKKLISLSPPDWSASLRPSFERKTRPDALIGPNDSTATGWKM